MSFWHTFVARWRARLKTRAAQKKQLAVARALLSDIPEAAALLKMADDRGVKIAFSSKLAGTNTYGYFTCRHRLGGPHIFLNPEHRSAILAATLAHELRHMQQHIALGLMDKNIVNRRAVFEENIKTALIIKHVMEADAYAFEDLIFARLIEKLEKSGGKQPTPSSSLLLMREQFMFHMRQLGEYDAQRIKQYYTLYTNAAGFRLPRLPVDRRLKLTPEKIKNLLTTPEGNNYFTDQTPLRLCAMVLDATGRELRKPLRLIEAFEKALATDSLNKSDNLQARQKIARALQAAAVS